MTMPEPFAATPAAVPRTVLARPRGLHGAADAWRHRRLVVLLAKFELRRRYRHPVAHLALVLAQPVLLTVVATAVFGRAGTLDGVPYAVYALSGLIPWQLVQSALVGGDTVLSSSERFIPRVHFPPIVVPFAAVGASLTDLVPTFILLFVLMAYWQVSLAGTLGTLPLWMLLGTLQALAVALWMLPIRVRHPSVRNVIPFLSIVWLLGSPVFWGGAALSPLQPMLGLNPMTSVVLGFRSALFGTASPSAAMVVMSLVTTGIVLISGWAYFGSDRLGDLLEFRVVRPGPRQ